MEKRNNNSQGTAHAQPMFLPTSREAETEKKEKKMDQGTTMAAAEATGGSTNLVLRQLGGKCVVIRSRGGIGNDEFLKFLLREWVPTYRAAKPNNKRKVAESAATNALQRGFRFFQAVDGTVDDAGNRLYGVVEDRELINRYVFKRFARAQKPSSVGKVIKRQAPSVSLKGAAISPKGSDASVTSASSKNFATGRNSGSTQQDHQQQIVDKVPGVVPTQNQTTPTTPATHQPHQQDSLPPPVLLTATSSTNFTMCDADADALLSSLMESNKGGAAGTIAEGFADAGEEEDRQIGVPRPSHNQNSAVAAPQTGNQGQYQPNHRHQPAVAPAAAKAAPPQIPLPVPPTPPQQQPNCDNADNVSELTDTTSFRQISKGSSISGSNVRTDSRTGGPMGIVRKNNNGTAIFKADGGSTCVHAPSANGNNGINCGGRESGLGNGASATTTAKRKEGAEARRHDDAAFGFSFAWPADIDDGRDEMEVDASEFGGHASPPTRRPVKRTYSPLNHHGHSHQRYHINPSDAGAASTATLNDTRTFVTNEDAASAGTTMGGNHSNQAIDRRRHRHHQPSAAPSASAQMALEDWQRRAERRLRDGFSESFGKVNTRLHVLKRENSELRDQLSAQKRESQDLRERMAVLEYMVRNSAAAPIKKPPATLSLERRGSDCW